MSIPISNLTFLWEQVVNPRLGCDYTWGGSFDSEDVTIGTDCSGAVSAELCALMYGEQGMIWDRQFYTGTFAGANPGDTGPFGDVDCTTDLVCITSPAAAPFGTAMIIAVRQEADPEDSHTIISVPEFVGGPWTTIEMGGDSNDYHLGEVSISDPEFNQFFMLPGPIVALEGEKNDRVAYRRGGHRCPSWFMGAWWRRHWGFRVADPESPQNPATSRCA